MDRSGRCRSFQHGIDESFLIVLPIQMYTICERAVCIKAIKTDIRARSFAHILIEYFNFLRSSCSVCSFFAWVNIHRLSNSIRRLQYSDQFTLNLELTWRKNKRNSWKTIIICECERARVCIWILQP